MASLGMRFLPGLFPRTFVLALWMEALVCPDAITDSWRRNLNIAAVYHDPTPLRRAHVCLLPTLNTYDGPHLWYRTSVVLSAALFIEPRTIGSPCRITNANLFSMVIGTLGGAPTTVLYGFLVLGIRMRYFKTRV